MNRWMLGLACCCWNLCSLATAHDTWVQSGPLVARRGDVVHVDLMLGNHGNQHRDFKLASKITLAPCTLQVISPDGAKLDIKPMLKDMGSAEKEGFWSARMLPEQIGVYQIIHTLDTLHGKTRAVKSSKTFFIASECFESIPTEGHQRIQALQQGLELVLETPLVGLAAGKPIALRVLWNGKPLPNASVAFVPRGVQLAEGTDPQYERISDAQGNVSFTPSEGNLILAVAHHGAPDETGEGYDKTHYGATLVLPVPHRVFQP